MTNIREILSALAACEDELRAGRFLSPCVGGTLHVRGRGLLYTFTPEPKDFEGWGIFEPLDEETAMLVEEASPAQIDDYLKPLKQLRLRLCYRLQGQMWMASAVNEADLCQRFKTKQAQVVCLAGGAAQFEQVIARWDHSVCWFEELDRRADPLDAERLRRALDDLTLPAHLNWKGCTPEMRSCYVQARQQQKRGRKKLRREDDEERLRDALAFGGGQLRAFHDRGNYWQVEWVAHEEDYTHVSAIEKRDLTVMEAGICLSGRDRDFDLQSLVKVAGHGGDYW
ncbi:MAG TPA: hypothetical protein VGC64_07760 [Pyrinomonadaceae bacterium]|jgi:hypothetical protein